MRITSANGYNYVAYLICHAAFVRCAAFFLLFLLQSNGLLRIIFIISKMFQDILSMRTISYWHTNVRIINIFFWFMCSLSSWTAFWCNNCSVTNASYTFFLNVCVFYLFRCSRPDECALTPGSLFAINLYHMLKSLPFIIRAVIFFLRFENVIPFIMRYLARNDGEAHTVSCKCPFDRCSFSLSV